MTVSVKDLRYKTKAVLDRVGKGRREIITHRGREVAQLLPLTNKERRVLSGIGYGMWSDHTQTKDVNKWLDGLRRQRHGR